MEYSQACSFLEDKLGIQNAADLFASDRANLLDDIVDHFQNAIPFHNLFLLSVKPGAPRIPTMEENIRRVLNLEGGLCWTLNSVMCLLLQALGYDAYPSSSTVHVDKEPKAEPDHIITIVRNLRKTGDRHFVEVGMGTPTFRAIPPDFKEESPVYIDSYITYKFVKNGADGKITRMHKLKPSSTLACFANQGEWGQLNSFDLDDPCTFDLAKDLLDRQVYSNPKHFFNQKIWIMAFRENRAVSLRANTCLSENEAHKMVAEEVKDADMVKVIADIVPNLPKNVIEDASGTFFSLREI